MRVGEHFRQGQDRAAGHAGGAEPRFPFARARLGQLRLQHLPQCHAVGQALRPVGEARVGTEGDARRLAQRVELLFLVADDVDLPLAAAERAGGRGSRGLVANGLRRDARVVEVADRPGGHGAQRRIQHGDVDALALSGHAAAIQRGRHGKGGDDGGHAVADHIAGAGRRGLGGAGHAHQPGEALDDLVVARPLAQRTFLAEAGYGAVDDARVHCLQFLEAEAKSLHGAGAEILEDDVGLGHQAQEQRLAARVLQVQRQAALAGVHRQEAGAHEFLAQLQVGAQLARQVAAAGHFHLDHLGPQHRHLQ